MKTAVRTLLALIGGFIGGLMLSELMGVIGYLLFHQAIGIRYLPFYLAVVSAVAVNVADRRRKSN